MLRSLKSLAVAALAAVLLLPADAGGTVIGSFDTRAGQYSNGAFFSLFGGSLFGSATAALTGDGHSLVNLDAGIDAGSLAAIDTVYLPLSDGGGASPLGAAEVTALESFVTGGGNLVVQADYSGYASLLSTFGVTQNGFGTTSPHIVTGSFAPITDGPYGTVSSFFTGTGNTFNLPAGGIALDSQSAIAVMSAGNGLAAGSGTLVLLGDVNTFDGPGNTNGFSREDDAVLWRNIFAMERIAAVPAPGVAAVCGHGRAGLGIARRRRAAQ